MFAGAAVGKDTDSGQFAVVWTNQAGKVVGQYTNAKPQVALYGWSYLELEGL